MTVLVVESLLFESTWRTTNMRWMEGAGKGWMKEFSPLSFVTLYFFWQWPVWKNLNYCHAALFMIGGKMHLLQREGPFCWPLVNFELFQMFQIKSLWHKNYMNGTILNSFQRTNTHIWWDSAEDTLDWRNVVFMLRKDETSRNLQK